jgi:hypothetical protein
VLVQWCGVGGGNGLELTRRHPLHDLWMVAVEPGGAVGGGLTAPFQVRVFVFTNLIRLPIAAVLVQWCGVGAVLAPLSPRRI